MKRLLYTFAVALLGTMASAQTFQVKPEFGQAWGGGTSIDLNSDGNLDFIIVGEKPSRSEPVLDDAGNPVLVGGIPDSTNRWTSVNLFNPSNNSYERVATNLKVSARANFDWYDLDGDGLLDLIASEHSFANHNAGLYKNLGDGKFELIDTLLCWRSVAASFGDFNNDGLMDYVCLSNVAGQSGVCINQGDGTFEKTSMDALGSFRYGLGYVKVIDMNNDGLMDIFVSANWDNWEEFDNSARVIADFFINNDEEPGTFFRANIGDNGVKMKANGGVDFADFNGDGWVDFALHGEGGAGTGDPSPGQNEWRCISRVYINQKNNTFLEQPQAAFQPDLRPLNSSGRATATIDWDYDGHYDLIITGWNPVTDGVGSGTQAGYLYKGNGSGTFTEVGRVPGGSETVLLFNDWNNDGFLDYLVSGHCWDPMWYTPEQVGRTAGVFFNSNTTSANQPPSAPTNLSQTGRSNGNVTLSWGASTDDKTPAAVLSYEYFVRNSDGDFVVAPKSFVGGSLDGQRKVLELGNATLNLKAIIRGLPDGTYTWGVQAIDASYAGSAFATTQFTLVGGAITSARPQEMVRALIYPNPTSDIIYVQAQGQVNSISILSMDGKLIKSVGNANSIEVKGLSPGMYIVRVAQSGSISHAKVLVK